jgi:hypothetical protein
MEGIYKYGVEMDSVAMIYIPRFIKIGSGVQMLKERLHRHTGSKESEPDFISSE